MEVWRSATIWGTDVPPNFIGVFDIDMAAA